MNFRRSLEGEEANFMLAPMVDMLFILIIFLLVTTTYGEMESEIDIELPAAKIAQPQDRGPREVVVNIRPDGVMVIHREPYTSERLLDTLKRLAEANPDQGVIIRADANALHQYVIHVMDLCRQAGITNISFPVAQLEPERRVP